MNQSGSVHTSELLRDCNCLPLKADSLSLFLKERLSSFYKERRVWLRETTIDRSSGPSEFEVNLSSASTPRSSPQWSTAVPDSEALKPR